MGGKKGGRKGHKGWGKRPGRLGLDDVNDFVAWAKDPNTDDGRGPGDHFVQQREEEIEGFMSWAKNPHDAKDEPDDDTPNLGMKSFMEWATHAETDLEVDRVVERDVKRRRRRGSSDSDANSDSDGDEDGDEPRKQEPGEVEEGDVPGVGQVKLGEDEMQYYKLMQRNALDESDAEDDEAGAN